MPGVVAIEELREQLNPKNVPEFEAIAPQGVGVFDTLKAVAKLVLQRARKSRRRYAPQPGRGSATWSSARCSSARSALACSPSRGAALLEQRAGALALAELGVRDGAQQIELGVALRRVLAVLSASINCERLAQRLAAAHHRVRQVALHAGQRAGLLEQAAIDADRLAVVAERIAACA